MIGASSSATPRSLRSRVVVPGIVGGLLLVAGMVAMMAVGVELRSQLGVATEAFVEEQQIADRIVRAVMRQMVVSSALPASGSERARREFQDAGEILYDQVRLYLFRDLSPEERLQLEEIREDQQRLEVAAARAADLYSRGLVEDAERSRDAMIGHAFDLLGAMEAFLRMREAELEALQLRQTTTVTALFAGVGFLGFLILLGPLYIGGLLHRRVARPIRQLVEGTRRMESGEFSFRVSPGEDLEFRTLSDGFNRMAEGLERMTRDLEGRNLELAQTLAQLEATQHELIQSEKLGAMGRMAAGLAHELNNPLATVLGYAQLLDERVSREGVPGDTELRQDFLTPILQQAERARHLVGTFLHFARKSDSKPASIQLADAVSVVKQLREESFRQAGLEVEVDIPGDLYVIAEPQMLQSILLNLVNNSMDAMAPQGRGRLRVEARRQADVVEVDFQDSGPGLLEPDRVFEPFYTTKAPGAGTGLGLALTHRFMHLCQGRITAGNSPGGGALFRLTFAPGVEPSRDLEGEEATGTPGSGSGLAETPVAPSTPPAPGGPVVLVVEDEAPLRALQERALSRLGVRVLTADSAQGAREQLAAEAVDAIVCDVKMPGESGLDFYRWLRATHPELCHRFIFVTGDAGHPELQALMQKEPALFLWKPFKLDEYRRRVLDLVEPAPAMDRPTDPH